MRKPTTEELEEMLAAGQEIGDPNYDGETIDVFENVVVFDNYSTDSPGYVGPVFIHLWGGAPNALTVFIKPDSGMSLHSAGYLGE